MFIGQRSVFGHLFDFCSLSSRMLAEECFPPDRNPKIYVCGPTPFVEDVSMFLVELGHDASAIKTERFGPTGG